MLKDARRACFAAFAFSAFINVLLLSTPLYTLQIFETVVPLGSVETLVILTLMCAIAVAALSLLEIARDIVLLRTSVWLDHELGRHILENGLKLGVSPEALRQDARALEHFHGFIASPAAGIVLDAPFVPLFLAALVLLNPLIGAVAVVAAAMLVVTALVQYLLTARLQSESAAAHERSEKWWGVVARNGQLAGALGLAGGASAQWDAYNRSHIGSAYSHGKRTSLIKAMARAIRIGSQIALYGFGAWLVVKGEIAPGALVASAILLARALAPLEGLVSSVKNLKTAVAAYRRLKLLPDDASVPTLNGGATPQTGALSLADVTYYHPTRKIPALRGVSLTIEPGRSIGIVGPNGAGKSTLAATIAGAITPTSGSADLAGIAIAKWQRGDCEPPVGYVSDEPLLLEGSVHDNISRFGDMSLIAVARAAMRAGVHDVLQTLQHGYDTEVGPQGCCLALRERRAIAFARALAGSPRFLVLDEPEAGLDGTGMKRLMQVLANLKAEGLSLVIATQDPRLLSLTDKVVVLNGGTVQVENEAAQFIRDTTAKVASIREAR
jgi:PrtD family type I secretion system ABC transporter